MKSLIIVPYRDRETHLNCFLAYMQKYFPDMEIMVCEQVDYGKWNKGLLFNAGFDIAMKTWNYDYIILHDVDFIPDRSVDYSYTSVPTLLSTQCSQFDYGQCYPNFFGGVVGLTPEHYRLVNGFSNQFTGWGGEDDLFYRSFITKGIYPGRREGNRFENFTHPRPRVEQDYNHNLKVLESGRDFTEGLSTAEYRVVGKMVTHNYTHLRINTLVH